MTGVLLPALAAATVDNGQLVARTSTRVLHVAVPGPRGLTPTGRLRRGVRPLCGQTAVIWRASQADGRSLCRRCAAHLERRTTPAQLQAAAPAVRLEDLVLAVTNARTTSDLSALQILACNAGLIARPVPGPRGPRPLHTLFHEARVRLMPPGPPPARVRGRAWGPTAPEARRSASRVLAGAR